MAQLTLQHTSTTEYTASAMHAPMADDIIFAKPRYRLVCRLNYGGTVDNMYSVGCVGVPSVEGQIISYNSDVRPSVRHVVSLGPRTLLISPFRGDKKCNGLSGLRVPVVRTTSCVRASPLKETR